MGKSSDSKHLRAQDDKRVYRRNAEASFSRFGDEGLIVVPRRSMNVVVNDLALRVYEMLDGTLAAGDLAERIVADHEGVSRDQALVDLVEVLDDLESKGAVEVVDAAD